MNDYLDTIRKKPEFDKKRAVQNLLISVSLGLIIGIVSKYLDEVSSNNLPYLLELMDIGNFLSRMGVWLFIALLISIKSDRPLNASINVFMFFLAMLIGYYAYTILISGFYPRNYILIWLVFTVLSFFIAYVCWYSYSEHLFSIILSSLIMTIMLRQTFAFGFWYFDLMYFPELIVLIATISILYQNPQQILKVIGIAIVLFLLTSQSVILYGFL